MDYYIHNVICTNQNCRNTQDAAWFGYSCIGCGDLCTEDGQRHGCDVRVGIQVAPRQATDGMSARAKLTLKVRFRDEQSEWI